MASGDAPSFLLNRTSAGGSSCVSHRAAVRHKRLTPSSCPSYFWGKEPALTRRSHMGLLWSEDILSARNWNSTFTFIWGQNAPFSIPPLSATKINSTLLKVSSLKAIFLPFVQAGDVLRLAFMTCHVRFPLQAHLSTLCSRARRHPVEHPAWSGPGGQPQCLLLTPALPALEATGM